MKSNEIKKMFIQEVKNGMVQISIRGKIKRGVITIYKDRIIFEPINEKAIESLIKSVEKLKLQIPKEVETHKPDI
jgi:hypothetical protein